MVHLLSYHIIMIQQRPAMHLLHVIQHLGIIWTEVLKLCLCYNCDRHNVKIEVSLDRDVYILLVFQYTLYAFVMILRFFFGSSSSWSDTGSSFSSILKSESTSSSPSSSDLFKNTLFNGGRYKNWYYWALNEKVICKSNICDSLSQVVISEIPDFPGSL